jgi:hypothetical protein
VLLSAGLKTVLRGGTEPRCIVVREESGLRLSGRTTARLGDRPGFEGVTVRADRDTFSARVSGRLPGSLEGLVCSTAEEERLGTVVIDPRLELRVVPTSRSRLTEPVRLETARDPEPVPRVTATGLGLPEPPTMPDGRVPTVEVALRERAGRTKSPGSPELKFCTISRVGRTTSVGLRRPRPKSSLRTTVKPCLGSSRSQLLMTVRLTTTVLLLTIRVPRCPRGAQPTCLPP